MECRCSCPLGGFHNVKPLSLPLVGSFGERAFWAGSVGKLAYYSTAALRLFPVDYLRLHTKGLELEAEVWGDLEEGLARNDKHRDVEDRVQG